MYLNYLLACLHNKIIEVARCVKLATDDDVMYQSLVQHTSVAVQRRNVAAVFRCSGVRGGVWSELLPSVTNFSYFLLLISLFYCFVVVFFFLSLLCIVLCIVSSNVYSLVFALYNIIIIIIIVMFSLYKRPIE